MIHTRPLVLFILLLAVSFPFLSGCTEKAKEPAVAGLFYPADRDALSTMIDGYLSSAENRPVPGKLVALIAPHAGYQYSGSVAAFTYSYLKSQDVRTVILIGPSHRTAFNGVSVYERGGWKTPLGTVKINRDIARSLIDEKKDVTFFPPAFEREHSLEVQLPFLQRIDKKIQIVPILTGTPTRDSFEFLTARLTEILRQKDDVILLASTDFSHYHDYPRAVAMDGTTIDAIERMSIRDVQRLLMTGEGEMCGSNAVLYTMAVAKRLGATNGILYRYANSGDATGDMSRVVGYAALGLYKSPLTAAEKKKLLDLARDTITSYVREGKTPEVAIQNKRLQVNGATFVTIKTGDGMLRGCMGNIEPIIPLHQSIVSNAVNACSRDPRFHPLTEGELSDIDVEVTVLSPLEPLENSENIEIGRHGLYIIKDNRTGILLPQVPVENGWDRETFLRQVSRKAGLSEDAWKEARLFSFTADIIR